MDLVALADQLVGWFQPDLAYAVALSGGVDSAVVAKAASLSQSDVFAVTARSASVSAAEIRDASSLAKDIGIRHAFVEPRELESADYQKNDTRRCYFCKTHLYAAICQQFPGRTVVSGTNADDLHDYRPGLQAAEEAEVRAPLAELNIDKRAIRGLAQHWMLHVADKPASPCLASRIAHGVAVTPARLQRIEQAEMILRELGLVEFRVRLHEGELARIEVPSDQIAMLSAENTRRHVIDGFKRLGFRYVTLDLEGFRSGSLNPVFQIVTKSNS